VDLLRVLEISTEQDHATRWIMVEEIPEIWAQLCSVEADDKELSERRI
jgi:hypothetical protein